jgi:tRNA U34 5-carboxymethylaminomethyl modifying enzyme MnmG/GidA
MVVKHDPSKDLYFKYTNTTTIDVYINGLRQSLPQDILNALSSSTNGVEVDIRVLRVGVMAS